MAWTGKAAWPVPLEGEAAPVGASLQDLGALRLDRGGAAIDGIDHARKIHSEHDEHTHTITH